MNIDGFFLTKVENSYPDDTAETSMNNTPINDDSSILLVSVVLSFVTEINQIEFFYFWNEMPTLKMKTHVVL